MPDPEVRCKVCDRHRNPMQHMRADFPPDAAKKWLKRYCERPGKPCDFWCMAGIDIEGLRRAWRKGEPR